MPEKRDTAPDYTPADKQGLKGNLPFSIGATSYVFPADILPNVDYLARLVDDVEILIFESDAISPLPDEACIRKLADYAREFSLSYTVHLPLDADIGVQDHTERQEAVNRCLRVIRCTEPLAPHSCILHLPAPANAESSNVREKWHESLSESAEELIAAGVDLSLLCVETLDTPFDWLEPIMDKFDLSVCLDVGHLLLYGHPVEPVIERYFARTRVIHMHGVEKGKDHRSISLLDPEVLSLLLSALRNDRTIARVATIEVFHKERLLNSLDVLKETVSAIGI